jgi:hypothetical protein
VPGRPGSAPRNRDSCRERVPGGRNPAGTRREPLGDRRRRQRGEPGGAAPRPRRRALGSPVPDRVHHLYKRRGRASEAFRLEGGNPGSFGGVQVRRLSDQGIADSTGAPRLGRAPGAVQGSPRGVRAPLCRRIHARGKTPAGTGIQRTAKSASGRRRQARQAFARAGGADAPDHVGAVDRGGRRTRTRPGERTWTLWRSQRATRSSESSVRHSSRSPQQPTPSRRCSGTSSTSSPRKRVGTSAMSGQAPSGAASRLPRRVRRVRRDR